MGGMVGRVADRRVAEGGARRAKRKKTVVLVNVSTGVHIHIHIHMPLMPYRKKKTLFISHQENVRVT